MNKLTILSTLLVASLTVNAQTMDHAAMSEKPSAELTTLMKRSNVQALDAALKELWNAHMYWTLITVDAFYNDPKGLQAKLNRLLQNQKDIGNAIVPFYGQAAGDKLGQLLTEHIQLAVPVLQSAKDGNKAALDKAVKDWYANAKEIGAFLHAANPKNWSAEETQGALEMHITHTIAYSVAILKGDYTGSFGGFEEALHHMVHLADILTEGIVKQFPDKF